MKCLIGYYYYYYYFFHDKYYSDRAPGGRQQLRQQLVTAAAAAAGGDGEEIDLISLRSVGLQEACKLSVLELATCSASSLVPSRPRRQKVL